MRVAELVERLVDVAGRTDVERDVELVERTVELVERLIDVVGRTEVECEVVEVERFDDIADWVATLVDLFVDVVDVAFVVLRVVETVGRAGNVEVLRVDEVDTVPADEVELRDVDDDVAVDVVGRRVAVVDTTDWVRVAVLVTLLLGLVLKLPLGRPCVAGRASTWRLGVGSAR